MEHLFCKPSKYVLDQRVQYAFQAPLLQHDWGKDSDVSRPSPGTEWLGFDHDDRTGIQQSFVWTHFESYPTIRGYDFPRVWQTGDPRSAHPSLEKPELGEGVVSLRVAAILQGWLTFG